MKAAAKNESTNKDLVLGLGVTGLSVARYLRRNDRNATFIDSRDEPPGIDELSDVWPDADVILGKAALPKGVGLAVFNDNLDCSFLCHSSFALTPPKFPSIRRANLFGDGHA